MSAEKPGNVGEFSSPAKCQKNLSWTFIGNFISGCAAVFKIFGPGCLTCFKNFAADMNIFL